MTIFVDDGRGTGCNEEHAWTVVKRYMTRLQFLGIQNAARKVRPPAQSNTGAWAGAIIETTKDKVTKTVSLAKLNKAKKIIADIIAELEESSDDSLDFKQLEKHRGYLIHVCTTYKQFVPFMKGIHQTLDSWRPNQKSDGWRMSSSKWSTLLAQLPDEERDAIIEMNCNKKRRPKRVTAVPRLGADLRALSSMLEPDIPAKVCVRYRKCVQAILGMGDAAKTGFCNSFITKDGISYSYGVWSVEDSSESSNYREFRNFLDATIREGEAGNLTDLLTIFVTDNFVTETAIYKGTSDSPLLLEMVIEFYRIQLKYSFTCIVVHAAGTRMIAQGGDGLSRGSINEGVMSGEDFLSFLPFNENAIERSPSLRTWIEDWANTNDLEFLSPKDWFVRGHDVVAFSKPSEGGDLARPIIKKGTFVWAPPPAAANVAVEEIRKARIKRHQSTHIILIPRLMTCLWQKQLFKACDFVCELKAGHPHWGTNMYEPLLIGFCFPYISFHPFVLKAAPKLQQIHRELRHVLEELKLDGGNILSKLCSLCRRVPTVSYSDVRQMLFFGQ